ncbi:MAG: hypothetical protein JXQ96_21245 [Cyclobacteriaceae bacterium]
MKTIHYPLCLILLILSCSPPEKAMDVPTDGPIQLHPENPHYFLYKGKSRALITSAEHYGAVLNLDFDYKNYLRTLASDGMNYTRIFGGSYFEIYGESFGIQKNTLAPKPGRVATPWKVSTADDGHSIYDLTQWNAAYFTRLKKFMTVANENDVIVEVTLFSSIYNDRHWDINPQNAKNNTNLTDSINYQSAHTTDNGELIKFQEMYVRKMVSELNDFDNFFFEIQNEPWADNQVSVLNLLNNVDQAEKSWKYEAHFAQQRALDWQEWIASFIQDEESRLEKKHLIAQNYVNYMAPIPNVSDRISIVNFHYAWPNAVNWNYHYDKVIGFDESGFAGSGDDIYRLQAWQFIMSGGSLFNNLDYSYFSGSEDGLGENKAPGGGGAALRMQLKVLSEFIHGFALEKLKPANSMVVSSSGLIPYVLANSSDEFAIFLHAVGTKSSTLALKADVGSYEVTFLNVKSGQYSESKMISAENGIITVPVDIPDGELAIRILKK